MDNYTIGGAAIVLTALIVAHMSSTKRTPAPLPPGPKGLPLVGNVADLPQSQPWLGFAELEEKYGTFIHFPDANCKFVLIKGTYFRWNYPSLGSGKAYYDPQ